MPNLRANMNAGSAGPLGVLRGNMSSVADSTGPTSSFGAATSLSSLPARHATDDKDTDRLTTPLDLNETAIVDNATETTAMGNAATSEEDLCLLNCTAELNASAPIYNDTYDTLNDTYNLTEYAYMYPSGYSMLQIILWSVIVTIIMIVIVVGNMLVIIAIATEKSLKNIQNWFIASLAVSDFFLGLVVMPFSLANELMGYWIFGYWWCEIHSAMDVLLCTASIMNLCLIGLDRYWSITQAVDYLKRRTPARAIVMITLVWILSALVCIPPLLGWKRPPEEEDLPKCKVRLFIFCFIHHLFDS